MIARRVPTRGRSGGKAGSGFGRLAGYVTTDKKGDAKSDRVRADEASTAGGEALTGYMTDQVRHDGRVRWTRVTNCGTGAGESQRDPHPDDLAMAIREIGDTQRSNTRGRSDPNYHLVISFPPGERPTREQIEDIEDELCAALGMADHQRISALHDDKAHLHLHVAINRVHPTTGKLASNYQDRPRLAAAAERLEIKHGLTRTNHEIPSEREGLRDRGPGIGEQGGRQSFADWIKERARDELMAASDAGEGWQGLHQVAARYGLEVKPRGAGLVIVNKQPRKERVTAVRASAIDRTLSFKGLTEKLGPYEPPENGEIPAIDRYGRGPLPGGRGGLWEEYKASQEPINEARRAALAARRAVEDRYRAELKDHYAEAFGSLKTQRITEGIDPKLRAEALKRERGELWERFKHENAKARAAIYERHPATGWKEWLTERADAGDKQAATTLQRMDNKAETIARDIEGAPDQASGIALMASRKPSVGKNGAIYYRLDDGGMVIETARGINLSQPSQAAAVVALDLAREKFGGTALTVGERPEVRAALIEAASRPGVDVKFADPTLEEERQKRQSARKVEAAQQGRPTELSPDISAWIDDQNRAATSSTTFRDLRATDVGRATFQGVMQIGSARAALWQQGRTTLVEELDAKAGHIAYMIRKGDTVTLEKNDNQAEAASDTNEAQEIDYDE